MIRHVNISTVQSVPELVSALNKGLRTLIDQINNDKPAGPQSLNGQRLADVGYPVAPNDAVTLSYLTREFKRNHQKVSTKPVIDASVVRIEHGSHAARLAVDVNEFRPGDVWFETDRTSYYQVRTSTGDNVKWVFMSGQWVSTIANLPSDLGTDDVGFEFAATDVDHCWRWGGSAWGWAPSERLPGELSPFSINPGNGWVLCTGGTATMYTPAGTGTVANVPNMVGYFVVGASSYTGTGTSEQTGTFVGTASSNGAHTHNFSGTSDASSNTTFATGTSGSASAAASSHTHNFGGTTDSNGDHTHIVTGTLSGYSPAKFSVMWFMRL